jgi:hypothetical protein
MQVLFVTPEFQDVVEKAAFLEAHLAPTTLTPSNKEIIKLVHSWMKNQSNQDNDVCIRLLNLKVGRQNDASEYLQLLLDFFDTYLYTSMENAKKEKNDTRHTILKKTNGIAPPSVLNKYVDFLQDKSSTILLQPSDIKKLFHMNLFTIEIQNGLETGSIFHKETHPRYPLVLNFLNAATTTALEDMNVMMNNYGISDKNKETDIKIYSFPDILVVLFNRFATTAGKINTPVDVRHEWDLSSYVINERQERVRYQYHLYGVVNHVGPDTVSGHYISFVEKGDTWYKCDDDKIETIPDKKQIDFNGIGQVYMLFYRRVGSVLGPWSPATGPAGSPAGGLATGSPAGSLATGSPVGGLAGGPAGGLGLATGGLAGSPVGSPAGSAGSPAGSLATGILTPEQTKLIQDIDALNTTLSSSKKEIDEIKAKTTSRTEQENSKINTYLSNVSKLEKNQDVFLKSYLQDDFKTLEYIVYILKHRKDDSENILDSILKAKSEKGKEYQEYLKLFYYCIKNKIGLINQDTINVVIDDINKYTWNNVIKSINNMREFTIKEFTEEDLKHKTNFINKFISYEKDKITDINYFIKITYEVLFLILQIGIDNDFLNYMIERNTFEQLIQQHKLFLQNNLQKLKIINSDESIQQSIPEKVDDLFKFNGDDSTGNVENPIIDETGNDKKSEKEEEEEKEIDFEELIKRFDELKNQKPQKQLPIDIADSETALIRGDDEPGNVGINSNAELLQARLDALRKGGTRKRRPPRRLRRTRRKTT